MTVTINNVSSAFSLGDRGYNEDTSFALDIDARFFAAFVFDGHGGAQAAEFLKREVPLRLRQLLAELCGRRVPAQSSVARGIKSIFKALNAEFRLQENTSGSTISGIMIDRKRHDAYTVQCGDSACIIYGPAGDTQYVTRSDPISDPAARAELSARHGHNFVYDKSDRLWRLEGVLNMCTAFGNFGISPSLDAALDRSDGRSVTVQCFTLPAKSVTVLLASDGLFDEVPPHLFSQIPLFSKMANNGALCDFIGRHGMKRDNITIVRFDIRFDK